MQLQYNFIFGTCFLCWLKSVSIHRRTTLCIGGLGVWGVVGAYFCRVVVSFFLLLSAPSPCGFSGGSGIFCPVFSGAVFRVGSFCLSVGFLESVMLLACVFQWASWNPSCYWLVSFSGLSGIRHVTGLCLSVGFLESVMLLACVFQWAFWQILVPLVCVFQCTFWYPFMSFIALPKPDRWLSSPSHFSSFNCYVA